MIKSHGVLQYGPDIRSAVIIDQQIAAYYLNLVPKYYSAQPQMYPAHITVVRFGIEIPQNMSAWGKYSGSIIEFEYVPQVEMSRVYFYLNAFSDQIGDIREELGLPRFRFSDHYHITIGNMK